MSIDFLLALLYVAGLGCFVEALRAAPWSSTARRADAFTAAGASLFIALVAIGLMG